ncbi:MAG: hypothetical protein ACOVR6_10485 [Fimbriimonas sp.]|jgi:hypothetical protein
MKMTQIRENIYMVSVDELGDPQDRGYFLVEGLGEVLIDQADLRYIQESRSAGYEPIFHVSKSDALAGAFVVVARQQKA